MFKIFAAILICAACMSPVVEGASAAVAAKASPAQNITPAVVNYYGTQNKIPLLTPNVGPMTSLWGAVMPSRTYIGQSNPVLIRTPQSTKFVGESTVAMIAM